MRLASLRLNQFGIFRNQEMELAPLTILFGANGAGKSTILEAIEDALIPSANRNRNRKIIEGLGHPNIRSAVVYATLDDWKIPGSSDERIMRDVLWMSFNEIEGRGEGDHNFVYPGDALPLQDLLIQRATTMIESGTIGTPEERMHIANHLLEHSVLAFGGLQGSSGTNWGLVCRTPLDDIAIPADAFDKSVVDDFTSGWHDFDELLTPIYDLQNGEDAIVTELHGDPENILWREEYAFGAARMNLSNRIRPLPMRLEFEPTTLDLELESFVDQIASRLTLGGFHSDDEVSWLVASKDPGFTENSPAEDSIKPIDNISAGTSNSLIYLDGSRSVKQVQPEGQAFILSSLIRNAVERIATHANSIAPKFLLQDSRIDIEILSPTEWKPDAPRLRATMNENGRKFPLASVGSGIARWASYSIRLACQELLDGTIVGDPNTDTPFLEDDFSYDEMTPLVVELPERISYDGATPYEEVAALRILPSKLDVVLLLDEPEAHLHPRAVASIGEWLLDISPRVASVVVATHHPLLFNLRGLGLQKYVVLRNQRESVSEPWNPASEELVDQLAHQIGLTAGDLFMMSRFVLFVEGPHDVIILEEFFGDLLRGSMVRLVPLHGAKNISLLAESEIVWKMGMPIGVLTDGTNIKRVMGGERSNHVEKLVDRMLRECKTVNREVAAFGLDLDDILFYLDDEITATFASGVFPGWSKAENIWKQIDRPANDPANGTKFKKWITETYGLPLERDDVRDIARKCKEFGNIPEELFAKVSELSPNEWCTSP
jgi:energy-coupling factor transporter ATP-binding protein EcfA2